MIMSSEDHVLIRLMVPLTDIPVGCLDCLQEFAFCDRIRVRNVH